jgi:hypothetical protein
LGGRRNGLASRVGVEERAGRVVAVLVFAWERGRTLFGCREKGEERENIKGREGRLSSTDFV